jgi:branched-chain amino acid transport system substrate-binding protein
MNLSKQIRSLKLRCSIAALAFGVGLSSAVQAQEPIRIAFIDPQSGTFAAQGVSGSLQMRFAVEHFVNSKGGVLNGRKFEVVTLDNKNSAQDTQIQLRRAISDGIQIVFSGNSSAVASVLSSSKDITVATLNNALSTLITQR